MGVDSFNGFYSPGETPIQLADGISMEVAERLLKNNDAFIRQNTFGSGPVVTYDLEKLKIVYEDMVMRIRYAHILYYTKAMDVRLEAIIALMKVTLCNKGRSEPGQGEIY